MPEENVNPVVKIVIGLVTTLFIAGIIVGAIMLFTGKAQNLTDEAVKTVDNIVETKYTQYDGESVSGSTVLNLIKTAYSTEEAIYIKVCTKANTAGTVYVSSPSNLTRLPDTTQSTLVSNATLKSNANYITPNAKFTGKIIRNANKAIVGIEFTQK